MHKRTSRKLSLNRETIRSLSNTALQGVAGGISGNLCQTSEDFICGGGGATGKCTAMTCPDTSQAGCGSQASCTACATGGV